MRLSLLQNQKDLPDDIQTEAIPNTSVITNSNLGNVPKNNMTQSHDQFTVIKVADYITKITQAYNTAQENTGRLIENAISQALTKAQSTATSFTSVETRNSGPKYANPSHEMSWTSAWLTSSHAMPQQPEINTYQIHRPCKAYEPQQTYTNQS